MTKIEKIEFTQYFNRSVEERFIEHFMNTDLEKLNELLLLNGVFCGMEKYVFLDHIGNLKKVEELQLKDYRKNYSVCSKPSELVHTFTFNTFDFTGGIKRDSGSITMNLLITIKDNHITSIISENNYIDSNEFEKRQFYN
jgi:hypothetical protein